MAEDSGFLIEAALGPGTVRRVTHEGKIDVRINAQRTHVSTGDARIDRAITESQGTIEILKERLPSLKVAGLVFEFSWYRIPVGWRGERLIFWDLGGERRQERLLTALLSP